MAHGVAVSACLVAFAVASLPAVATSPAPSVQLDVSLVLERAEIERQSDVIDTEIDHSLVENEGGPDSSLFETLEPGTPEPAWEESEDMSGVAIPVTEEISVGLDYELEQLEELTADRIEMGTASEDHASHSVMLRANIQFDLRP